MHSPFCPSPYTHTPCLALGSLVEFDAFWLPSMAFLLLHVTADLGNHVQERGCKPRPPGMWVTDPQGPFPRALNSVGQAGACTLQFPHVERRCRCGWFGSHIGVTVSPANCNPQEYSQGFSREEDNQGSIQQEREGKNKA